MKILEYLQSFVTAITMIVIYVVGGLLALFAYVLSILAAYGYFGMIGALIAVAFVPFAQLGLFIYLWLTEGFHQIYSYAFLGTIIVNSGGIAIVVLVDMLMDSTRSRVARRKPHRSIAR